MQDLKFRAWHWNKKRMFLVKEIDTEKREISGFWAQDMNDNTGIVSFDSCHIMQFTGLIDIKGREIYEGDIVDDTHGRIGIQQSTLVVKWNEKEARFDLYDPRDRPIPWKPHLQEVIGNIYDNSSLLRI